MRKTLLRTFPAVVAGAVILAGLHLMPLPAATAPAPAPLPTVDLSDLRLAVANNSVFDVFVDFQTPLGGTPIAKGDSTVRTRAGQVEANGVHFSGENPTRVGADRPELTASRFAFDRLELNKGLDKASTPLFMASATGGGYGKVVVLLDKQGGTGHTFFRITLGTVLVNSVSIAATPAYEETVSLSFGSARLEYFAPGPTGLPGPSPTTSQAWSVITNAPATDV